MTTAMIISAKAENSIEPVPEGLHPAVCAALYDVGTIYNERFDTAQRKLIISWELVNQPPIEVERDGRKEKLPRCLSRRFTASLNEKSHLRHVLESWRGKKFTESELTGFNVAKLIGVPAQIQVMHELGKEGRVFANVVNVLPPPRGGEFKAKSTPIVFSISEVTKPELPAGLPEWIEKLVIQSREWERLSKSPPPETTDAVPEPDWAATTTSEDDVPF